ncbi:type II secretion system F family protein [Candidatus Dojkabacteria bacterium]|uniref:Type II secretion system F family protein n=1 Tax=Candidatus Dojkabacteria bacterium TaxID=2099670 RepID=A0A955L4X5_9BACT|nr:type II secretion system F family protein [Candidatus Dojkabacteria bacterium]
MAESAIQKKKKKKQSIFNKSLSFGSGVSQLDVALAIRHLSIMLKSALALSDALTSLQAQTTNKKLAEIWGEIHDDVESGKTMADSMKKYKQVFSDIIISVISIGEQGGTLEKNLIFLSDFLKKNYELNRKVKGALVYPVVVMLLTFGEMSGVVFFILPSLGALIEQFETTPAMTLFILHLADFLRENILYVGLVTIILGIFARFYFRTKMGIRIKAIAALKFPIVKKLSEGQTLANFSRTLGILLESGIPIAEALSITSNTTTNVIYREKLIKVAKDVSDGKTVAESLSQYKKFFPETYTRIIEVGEQTGTLEENLLYLYDFYAEDVEEISNNLATLLEPILLVFIGIMIALLALTVIGPIYQLTGSIS